MFEIVEFISELGHVGTRDRRRGMNGSDISFTQGLLERCHGAEFIVKHCRNATLSLRSLFFAS